MGAMMSVLSRSNWAFTNCPFADSRAALAARSSATASSTSFWLTACSASSGLTRSRFCFAWTSRASAWATIALALTTAAWNGTGSIKYSRSPFLTSRPSRKKNCLMMQVTGIIKQFFFFDVTALAEEKLLDDARHLRPDLDDAGGFRLADEFRIVGYGQSSYRHHSHFRKGTGRSGAGLLLTAQQSGHSHAQEEA